MDLANAQSLRLKFSDFPNLNGEYRIAPDQTISIPAVGPVSVKGLNPRALEQAVAQKASSASGRQTFVTVEVLEYRPIFVTGQVNRAGPIAWQPKMTVLQAVASAGGLFRSASGGSGQTPLKRAIDDQKRWLASYARVDAELDGSEVIKPPKRLVELAGSSEANKLIEQQTKILAERRTALQDQLHLIAENKKLLGLELAALKQQRAKIEEQLQLRRDRTERIDQLYSKGLAVADVVWQQRLEVSNLEERSANVSVAIVRVQSLIAAADRDSANAVNSRRAELRTELQNLDRSITQGEFDLPATVGTTASSERKKPGYRYVIARANDDEQPDVSVEPDTELFPGDVLTVLQN